MKQLTLLKVGGIIASLATVSGFVISQSAIAQESSDAGREFIRERTYLPGNPSLKMAAAIILNNISARPSPGTGGTAIRQQFGGNQRIDVSGNSICQKLVSYNQVIFRFNRWTNINQDYKKPIAMSVYELEIAKTLFTEVDLKKTKNISVTQEGISADITLKDIGITRQRIHHVTLLRIKKQIDELNRTYEEVQRAQ